MTREAVEEKGLFERLESAHRVYDEARKRVIRAVIGGDYGFPWAPQGRQARDIEHFVELFGYPPPHMPCSVPPGFGSELMGRGDELGLLQPGFLADLLIVSGDPVADIRILQDQSKIVAVIKGGVFHREPEPGARAHKGRRAA